MPREYKPVDPTRISTYSINQRAHKAKSPQVATLTQPGASAADLFDSLPEFLGAKSLRAVVDCIVDAHQADRPVVVAFGAHVIKVGCGPILIDLIERGIVTAIACNGACAIHDMELAMQGETSEEVADTIKDGTFGMVQETLGFFDEVVQKAENDGQGLGHAVGRFLVEQNPAGLSRSVFAAAYRAKIPASIHVALGTDTIHVSPGQNGAAIGAASMVDFRLICDVVSDLGASDGNDVGGVWLNVGSAVLLPEVFLKAVSVARNLGVDLDAMHTANFDMIRHYRPSQNVVIRPVAKGHGHEVIGHHEILLPLLRQGVLDRLARRGGGTS